MNTGKIQEHKINFKNPGKIEYQPGKYCGKDFEFHRTRNMEEYDTQQIPFCLCKSYCLKEPTTWIGIGAIIVIIGLIRRFIKKHKKQ